MVGKLEYLYSGDNLFIEWTPDYEGSVSVSSEHSKGVIGMSSKIIPAFLYLLTVKMDDFNVLDKKLNGYISNSGDISSLYKTIKRILEKKKKKELFTRFFKDKVQENFDLFRKDENSYFFIEAFMKNNINFSNLDYVGTILNSFELQDKKPIHVFYSLAKETYVAKYWGEEVNILKLKETIKMIEDIIKTSERYFK